MRTIDADAIIEGYKHMGYDPEEHPEESYMQGWCKGFNSAVDHCIHHAIHAPTVSAEPQWIPISKKHPEDSGLYLTTTMYGEVYADYWNGINFDRTELVIAWMPLPEPYRKEGEE